MYYIGEANIIKLGPFPHGKARYRAGWDSRWVKGFFYLYLDSIKTNLVSLSWNHAAASAGGKYSTPYM